MTPEVGPFDAAIAEVEARIKNLQITLESLKQLRASADGATAASVADSRQEVEVQHDSFFGMTIADAVRKYLNMVKHTKSTAEIAEVLEQGGLKHASKDFQTTLRSVLGPREEFLRVNGEWGLASWYPGLGRGRKPKTEKPVKRAKPQNTRRANAKKHTQAEPSPESAPISIPSSAGDRPQARVEEYLRSHHEATARDVATALNLRIQTVGLILGKLKAKTAA